MVKIRDLAIEFIFLVLALAFIVNASGVAYTWNGDIIMRPGETKTVNFNLQNMIGEDDISFKVEIKNGSDIATLEKDEYLVKAKTYDTLAPLTITIPQDAQEGSRAVDVYFRTGAAAGGGTVSMGTGMRMPINVVIEKEKPVPSPEAEKSLPSVKKNLIFIAIGVIVLLIIVVYLVLRKRNK